MPKKCRNCGLRIIEYPLYKGQEEGKPFWEGRNFIEKLISLTKHDWNWRNVFIGDWTKLLIMLSLIFVAWAYAHDSGVYREIYSDPCSYVKKNIDACNKLEEGRRYGISPDLEILEIPNIKTD